MLLSRKTLFTRVDSMLQNTDVIPTCIARQWSSDSWVGWWQSCISAVSLFYIFSHTGNQIVFSKELAYWFLLLCNDKWQLDTLRTPQPILMRRNYWIEWAFGGKQLNYLKRLGSLKKVSEIKVLTTSYLPSSWGKRIKVLSYNVYH